MYHVRILFRIWLLTFYNYSDIAEEANEFRVSVGELFISTD